MLQLMYINGRKSSAILLLPFSRLPGRRRDGRDTRDNWGGREEEKVRDLE
jgi:hypothetical protein